MDVPHLVARRSMECWLATLDASSVIMSHASEQINAARIGVICQSASLKLSASCLQGYSFQLVFQLVFTSYTLQLPSICADCFQEMLFEQSGACHSKMLGFLEHIKREIQQYLLLGRMDVPHLMSIRPMECWLGRMDIPDLMSIRPMECWLATLNASSAMMSHALEQINAGVLHQSSALLACKATAFNLFSN